jgi:hypothetical protein
MEPAAAKSKSLSLGAGIAPNDGEISMNRLGLCLIPARSRSFRMNGIDALDRRGNPDLEAGRRQRELGLAGSGEEKISGGRVQASLNWSGAAWLA